MNIILSQDLFVILGMKITNTFFIEICDFVKMMENIDKKSFNINDLKNNNAIQINSRKKRTRYTYDIQKFVNESHL